MARRCVCQICKAKGNTDTFYKVTDQNGKNKYYCNIEEYERFIKEKLKRDNLFKFISEEVFEYDPGQIIPPVMVKSINDLHTFYDYEVIQECFDECQSDIKYWLNAKNFSSEYHMVRYVMKIIESKINDVYKKWRYEIKQKIEEENNVLDFGIINEMERVTPNSNSNNNENILDFLDEEDM
ncbi:hypothetical protein [Bacillus haynesii]|uniref:hypothetical protein n=1 Tax=Bacillus haynesii TaxID=1925021 RepID=UPI0003EDA03F|nr:hypothetical protein [Bacillus haynesii]EWH19850.1 hypothetical protein M769_0124595 [Bacillus haynesii]